MLQYGYFTDDHLSLQEIEKFPRRNRLEAEYSTIIEQHVKAWIPQTRRLIFSFEELDREARDTALLTRLAPSSEQHRVIYSYEELSRTRKRAVQYLARHMGVSEDDINSLKKSRAEGRPMDVRDSAGRVYAVEGDLHLGFVQSLFDDHFDHLSNWRWYKQLCRGRHEWGEYFRSNLEWDWDVASCLKRLFKQPKSQEPRRGGLRATIVAGQSGECKLGVTIDGEHTGPPKMVEVQYKTAEGEVKYAQYALNPVVKNIGVDADAKGNPRLSDEGPAEPMLTATFVPPADEGLCDAVTVETINADLKDAEDESKRFPDSRGEGSRVPEAVPVDLSFSNDEDLEHKQPFSGAFIEDSALVTENQVVVRSNPIYSELAE